MEPFRTPSLPDPATGVAPQTRSYLSRLLGALREGFTRIEGMPFNKSETVTVADTGAADTTVTAAHHLGRLPEGLLVTRLTKAGSVYVDAADYGNWSTTQVKFKCSTVNAGATLRVF